MSVRDPEQPAADESPSDERRVSRRQFVREFAKASGGVLTLGTANAAAAPSVDEYADTKRDHVTITGEADEWLDYYKPMLDLSAVPQSNTPTLRGWKLSSRDSDLETDVGVYCTEYAVQEGTISLTSHAGDHEWIYVFVDPSSGDVTDVSYSAYHWLRGYQTSPNLYTEDGGQHPTFRVANKYHNLIPITDTMNGVLMDVSSLGDYSSRSGAFYEWLQNGMNEDLALGSVHHAWNLAPGGGMDSWWSEDTSRVNQVMIGTWAFIGFTVGLDVRGSGAADPGEASL